MKRFCAKCGAEESEETPIIGGLCIGCYIELKRVVLVPRTLDIQTCSMCGALYIGGRWYYPSTGSEAREIVEKHLVSLVKPSEDIELENVSVELDSSSYREAKVVSVVKMAGGHRRRLEMSVGISWTKRLCPTCFKRAGKGFEAVVQIRFAHYDESIEAFKEDVVKFFYDYITEIDERDNGYDIKVASQSVARRIADMAKRVWRNVRVVESFGGVKRARDGSRRAKLYISVRIANLKEGDYVVVDGKAYIIKLVDCDGVVLVDSDGLEIRMDLARLLSLYERSRARGSRSKP